MRIIKLLLLLLWFILPSRESYSQYYFYRTKLDAGLILGYDFSRLNLTSYSDMFQKRIGTPIPYFHFGGYLNIPWAGNMAISTELMYARYGLNYRYTSAMYNLPAGISYDLNKERIQYLINNVWVRCKYGRFALQGGIKTSYLLNSSGTRGNITWYRPHDDLYQKWNVRLLAGAEYAFLNGAVTIYFHSGIPIFFDKNILSANSASNAFPNSDEMRLLDLQIGTKVRIGR